MPDPIDASDSFSGVGMSGDPITDGQIMTQIDNDEIMASWWESRKYDTWLLSDNLFSILDVSGSNDTTNTWIIIDPIPRLILSEVYFDGTDERIEITNIGDGNFSGNLVISGAKSTSVSLSNISIQSGESKVFGDNLSQVSGNRCIGKTWLALNIPDTAAINIQLLVSGQVVDVFLVDQYRVNLYNDKKTSFEKVAQIPTRVQGDRAVNAQSGILINPGIYFRTWTVTNVSFPPVQSWANFDLPVFCDSMGQRDLINIDEIFPGNEKYPPYIELAVHDDITLNLLSISGDRLATGLEFILNTWGTTLQKNSFLLISSTGFWQNEGIQSVRNRDFSLLSTWNRLLITIGSWQTRRVMDIVYLSGNTTGKSSYFSSNSYQCARILDYLDDFSPGFEQKFLKYFPVTTVTKIEYIPTATGSQSESGTCPLLWITGTFSWITPIDTGILSIPNQYSIRILYVDYDPPGSDTNNEKITLLATNLSGDQTPLDLSKTFRLKVNGTNKTLPRTLPMNTPTTFIKTFGFPNSTKSWENVIIQLTYDDFVFDTFTYNPNISDEKDLETGEVESTWDLLDLSWLQFTITYVLPNPKWSDKTEELGLLINRGEKHGQRNERMSTWQEIPVPSITSQLPESLDLSQEFTLRIEKNKKKIEGTIHVGQEYILSWSLWLVNKAACVSLFYKEQELAKFCYRVPKEWEKIFSSDSGLQETLQENLDILNTLSLKRITNQLCIRYMEQSFLCKRIPASKAELKTMQEQKLYKWFTSLIKQYIVNKRKSLYYDTSLKEYFDLVAQNKKLIAQWKTNVDIYGQSIPVVDLKQQIKVLETTLPWIVALYMGADSLY